MLWNITVDLVHKVLEQILDEDDGYLQRRWQELPRPEQQLLARLAELQGPGDETVPFQTLVPQEGDEQVRHALEQLVQTGLVKKMPSAMPHGSFVDKSNGSGEDSCDDCSYLLSSGLIRRWVSQAEPQSALLELAVAT